MEAVAGWMTRAEDREAHQVARRGTDQGGRLVYGSMCGRVIAPTGWIAAGPGLVRCPECQATVAGTPD